MDKDKLLQELKEQYEGKTLRQVEKVLSGFEKETRHYRREFIKGLYWIQHTEIFRQEPVYRKETFYSYLFDRHHLTEGTYRQEFWAYTHYPEDAEKWGTSLIASIGEKCGRLKVPKVLTQINQAQKKKKRFGRDDIQQVINKNLKPKRYETPKLTTSIRALRNELDRSRQTIRDQVAKIKQQEQQIDKLKSALLQKKLECAELQNRIAELTECEETT